MALSASICSGLKQIDKTIGQQGLIGVALVLPIGMLVGMMVGHMLAVALLFSTLIFAKMVLSRAAACMFKGASGLPCIARMAMEWLVALAAGLQMAYYLALCLGTATMVMWSLPLHLLGTTALALVIYCAVQRQVWSKPHVVAPFGGNTV